MSLRFRKVKSGPELDLVNRFLDHHQDIFSSEGLEVTVLRETFSEIGFPDILILMWDKSHSKYWKPERSMLQKSDLKIAHFISGFKQKGLEPSDIVKSLSFSLSQVNRSIENLVKADLVVIRGPRVRINSIKKHFFIKQIISIEAKIKDWRNAMNQAQLNKNFSSHSYLLLPSEKIATNILSFFDEDTGLLSFQENRATIHKKAKKSAIPGSYFSWMLNEYIGGQYFASACSTN